MQSTRFAADYLNQEYHDLARTMTQALCRKRPSPLTSGHPRTWACAIVYILGRVNFLDAKSSSPHMTTIDLCAAFGVGKRSSPHQGASDRRCAPNQAREG